jgi:hypothetical protein
MRRCVEVADPLVHRGLDGATRLVVGRLGEEIAELGCAQSQFREPVPGAQAPEGQRFVRGRMVARRLLAGHEASSTTTAYV